MDRILFLVDQKYYRGAQWEWVKSFSKILNARVMILTLVSRLGGKEEDEAWKLLYSMEDEAFDEEIKVSLFVEKRENETLKDIIEAYGIPMVIVARESGYLKELKGIAIPILLLP